MKPILRNRLLSRAQSAPRRSRKQHVSNLLLILLAGLIVFNIKSFLYGIELALEGYTDFSQFYAGAIVVKEGSGAELYSYETQERIQRQLFSTANSRTGPVLYYHAPFEILAFLPLTYISYAKAYLAWVIINLIILLAVPLLLLPYLPNLRPIFRINVVLSFFSFFPIFIAVYHGQDSLLLLLLFAAAFVSLKKSRFYLAGILLGLGLFRFHIVLPFMFLFLVKKQWNVIKGFCVSAVFVSIVSIFVTEWRGLLKYATFLLEINQNLSDRAHQVRFALYPRAMTNLRGLLYTLFSGHISDTVINLVSLSFSLIVLVCFFVYLRKEVQPSADFDLQFSLGIAVMLLIGIHVHLYDWTLLMLPILLLSNHYASLAAAPHGLPRWTLRLTASMLVMTPVYMGLIGLEFTPLLVIPLLVFVGLLAVEISSSQHDRKRVAPVSLTG